MSKCKYFPGDEIGPYNILLVERLPKSYGIFKCNYCGNNFKAHIQKIRTGHTKSCGCIRNHYYPGDKVGPHDIELVAIYRSIDKKKKTIYGTFICPKCGNYFSTAISSVNSGATQSCGCYHKTVVSERTRKDLTGQKIGKLSVIRPTDMRYNNRIVCECKCDCGNTVFINSNALSMGTINSCGCLISKGEAKLKQILSNLDIRFKSQKVFDNCINPNTNALLKFDFYLLDYNICIEYDGEQHFRYRVNDAGWNTKENFIELQKRDQIKTKYCQDNHIGLIRIPYTDFNILDEDYLLSAIDVIRNDL